MGSTTGGLVEMPGPYEMEDTKKKMILAIYVGSQIWINLEI